MDITDEMVEAGAKLIAEEHGSEVFWPDHEPNEYTDVEREQYRAEARAVIELVAPLIAAQALRQAAEVPTLTHADVLAEALRSARSQMAMSSQDWSVRHDFAWLYGIFCGWDDDPDDPMQLGAMADVATRCGWTVAHVERLRLYAAAVEETIRPIGATT